jgi:6-phosphofructokinase 1
MKKVRLFLCYSFNDVTFIKRVYYYLDKQETIKPYWWEEYGTAYGDFQPQIGKALLKSDAFLLFLGEKLGETQKGEVAVAILNQKIKNKLLIKLGEVKIPKSIKKVGDWCPYVLSKYGDEDSALRCAQTIVRKLGLEWKTNEVKEIPYVPEEYLFDYEKDIIKEYIKGISGTLIGKGCPIQWSSVKRNRIREQQNPVEESMVGLYRDWDYSKKEIKSKDPQVIPAALSDYHDYCLKERNITFPEAGPRKVLYYPAKPNRDLRVGILVSGGIAPGINSVITGIVERQSLYANKGEYIRTLRILGFLNGFSAITDLGINTIVLGEENVANIIKDGGSFIGSSRVEILADYSKPIKRIKALRRLARRISEEVEILYIIGGHGSMRAAHAIWMIANYELHSNLSVVTIPKTMDNDILWVWQSFGFMSAVEKAEEIIDYMYTEVKSSSSLCVIQLFGSDSGFVASHAVQASGLCDICLIPEVPFTMEALSSYVKQILINKCNAGENPCGIIVMAETAVPIDVDSYINDRSIALSEEEKNELRSYHKTRRLTGHTPSPLGSGALKIVSKVLTEKIREMEGEPWNTFRVITNEPKYIVRAIPPSCSDMIFGQRLGSLAVDCAMAGYTDFMISQWLTEYVMVPLPMVILGRKRIPKEGIFWNSVKATTGQPDLI